MPLLWRLASCSTRGEDGVQAAIGREARFDFTAQVVIGAAAFVVVLVAAALIGTIISLIERLGFSTTVVHRDGGTGEKVLFWSDLFTFSLFLLSETAKLIRGLIREWHVTDARQSDTFTVDAAYLRTQAREALTTFVAPFSGVVRALQRDRPTAEVPKRSLRKLYSYPRNGRVKRGLIKR